MPTTSGTPDQDGLVLTLNKLKAAGHRVTKPRIAILTELVKRAQPVSIEELHKALAGSACDVVTVYRCLGAFEQIGLVRRTFLFSGTTCWEIVLGGDLPFYVTCKATDRILAIENELTADLRKSAAKVQARLESKGYRDVKPAIQFFAVAPTS
jgi:Fur family ferric uptake transcriptional regulator